MKKVIVIVGPTGSGKTGLSIKLAKNFNLDIINGDSVQIYQGLDIGSAKIKENEKQNIKHHLLDITPAGSEYSVYNFQKDARKLIDELETPMIVGGTGLYIQAALYDYEFVEDSRSKDFESQHAHESNEEIYQKLLVLDPEVKVDYQNRRRLLRSYEQALLGYPRSTKKNKDTLLYDALIIYLDLDRKVLEDRLNLRLERQLEEGFIDEVKSLKQQGITVNAIGYRELNMYLDGKYSLQQAKEEIIKSSKKLAKRQKTWFKNQMHPIMLDALSPSLYNDAKEAIKSFLKEK
ncbi:MAG: tRNA (adenosine(37)-N6)-dimethylallyltransferase MiaA [Tenericutes bacterium HGW-Tenericutes-3]|nr:MAG: tRNA (adenosine(37)-N6)-dimethylallyltransferase MiaA [Tenericutes bacterium HGW-Tenericutes-3]